MRSLVNKLENIIKDAKPLSRLVGKTDDKPGNNLSAILQSQSSGSNFRDDQNISKLFQEKANFYRIDEMVKMKTQDHRQQPQVVQKKLGFFNKKRKSFTLKEDIGEHGEEKETLRNQPLPKEQESLCETDRFKDVLKFAKPNYKISSKKRTDKKKKKKRIFERSKIRVGDASKSRLLFDKKKPSRDSNKRKKKRKSRDKSKRNISASKSKIKIHGGKSRDTSLVRNKTEKSLYKNDPFNQFLSKISRSKKRAKSSGGRYRSNIRKSRVGINSKVIGYQKYSIMSNKKYI